MVAASEASTCCISIFLIVLISMLSAPAVAVAASSKTRAVSVELDSSCQPVITAMDKAALRPFHETVSVNDQHYEKIQTTTALYIGSSGRWSLMASSPDPLSNSVSESGLRITGCALIRKEVLDGESATVYSAQQNLAASSEKSRMEIWIADSSGLPLKSESDGKHAGRESHVSTRYSFTHVQAPAGAH
ncbi:MAG: hypothetical protein ABI127_01210 [Dokdonella sp.]